MNLSATMSTSKLKKKTHQDWPTDVDALALVEFCLGYLLIGKHSFLNVGPDTFKLVYQSHVSIIRSANHGFRQLCGPQLSYRLGAPLCTHFPTSWIIQWIGLREHETGNPERLNRILPMVSGEDFPVNTNPLTSVLYTICINIYIYRMGPPRYMLVYKPL